MKPRQEDLLARGNLLWEGSRFLLPEHKQAVLPLFQADERKPKPEIDEQLLTEFAQILMEAMQAQTPVSLTYWGCEQFHTLVGTPISFDPAAHRVHLRDVFQDVHRLPIHVLVDVRHRELD